jgi:hypothetical protein
MDVCQGSDMEFHYYHHYHYYYSATEEEEGGGTRSGEGGEGIEELSP